MLVQSDSVHTLGEDMETSTAQRIYQLRSRLEVERRGPKILQEEFPMRGLRRTGISGPPAFWDLFRSGNPAPPCTPAA
jgi:hypothetical protein